MELAERAVGSKVECPAGHRVKQVMKALHHGDARGVGGLGDALGLGVVAGERLLGEDGLARRDRRQVPGRVQRIRQGL